MFNLISSNNTPRVCNAKEVLNIIRKHNTASAIEIFNKTGMPRTTLNRTIEDLLSIGLIKEAGMGESTGGRPPIIYQVKSDAYYLIGVDISRTLVKIVLSDLNLNILDKSNFEVEIEIQPNTLLKEIILRINSITTSNKVNSNQILGVGVGIVGVLSSSGTIINAKGFLDNGWNNFPIKHYIEKELGIITVINNGANAAILAEYWQNIGKKYKNIVYIIAGLGLRCGIIHNGELISEKFNEDILSHMIIEFNGRKCTCGSRGCIEMYASIPAIVQAYKHRISEDKHVNNAHLDNELSWENVCEAVKYSEKAGIEVISEAALYLSTGITNIVNLLNPEIVMLGGLAINTCDLLYDISVSLSKDRISKNNKDIVFGKGTFNEDAIVVGSASLVLDYYLGREVSGHRLKKYSI